ncbi:MAG: CoA transferase [Chloroflexi bacterium]|nr:CoA transferase [Chloroflexota bacterium]MDA1174252.1 CoA transferase [Chloroflexota bacterium]
MREFDPNATGPLTGVRVLDLSRLVAGNMLSLQLADFGADVIKVEPADHGDPLRAWGDSHIATSWKVYARNKKSLALNLRDPAAIDILLRLAENSAIMIEGFRPGRLEQMGLGPDALHARNPKLVLVRISGFGQTGPYRERPGFGTLIEAMSGFADRNGFPDREPVLPPLALADMVAGLNGAAAVLMALREVEVNGGTGQVIDLSLLEPLFSILGAEAAGYRATGKLKQRVGSASNTASPRNVYASSDGKWVALSASIQSMVERVFRVIGKPELINDPRFATNTDRVQHHEEVDGVVAEWIAQRTQEESLRIFAEADVTAGPVYDIAQFMEDPHVQEREIIVELPDDEMGTIPMHNIVPTLSGTPGGFRLPAPRLGQHNDELLTELGFDSVSIANLREQGVIS